MYYVYAIYNPAHDKIYIGKTSGLAERIRLHNDHSLKGYTSRFDGKWELIYKEPADSRQAALKREKQLKSYRGRQFIKKYIPGWRSGSAVDC
jgi:putative endonuclease